PFYLLIFASELTAESYEQYDYPYYPGRFFASEGCLGVYNPAKFGRLLRVCLDCWYMYRDDKLDELCKKDCFDNEYFFKCLEALLLLSQKEKFQEMVSDLHGKK
ncbi:hypothetical protein B4U79_09449, partial [Dinothrombium tinctorium]